MIVITDTDPYQFVEALDQQVIDYSNLNTLKFKEEFGTIAPQLRREVEGYSEAKTLLLALIRGEQVVTLYSEGDEYRVSLNGRDFYSSTSVIFWVVASNDARRIAVFESGGSDVGTLTIFADGKITEKINGAVQQLAFTESSYYVTKTYMEKGPPDGGEVNSHRVLLGDDIVFGSGLKATEFIRIYESAGQAIVTVGDWNHSAIYLGKMDNPSTWKKLYDLPSPAKPLGIRNGEVCYLEKTGNGIIKTGTRKLIEATTPIEDCVMVEEGFLVFHLRDAKISPALYGFDGQLMKEYELSEPMGLSSADSDEKRALVNLESFGTPYALYRFENGKLSMVEENRLLDIKVEEHWAKSSGADIHYFLMCKGSPQDKKAVAYGYGGYNISLSPTFSPLFATLLNNGISVVQANLRGGGEYGQQWHFAGVREKKQNVFDDFISVISQLKGQGYSVVAMGGSNGGLLVGSVLTQKPELLDGAVIGNPVLDMMRFHLMSVGKYWTTEYGNPEDPHDADFLMKYSPYHNLRNSGYPMVFIYTRLHDDRVHPAHAIKFHMKLASLNEKAYLRVNQSGGHAGITTKERAEETCENYNFICKCFQ